MLAISRNGIIGLATGAAIVVATIATAGVSSADQHAGGPFSETSINGSYAFVYLTSGAGEGWPTTVSAGMAYFDGQGNYRFFVSSFSEPGEPDADGNATRDVTLSPKDPTSWFHFAATHEVHADGVGIFYRPFQGTDDPGEQDMDLFDH